MNNEIDNTDRHPDLAKNILRRMVQILIFFLLTALILFLSAGSFTWIWAWIYIVASAAYMVVNVFILPKELIAERGKAKENVKPWDRVITKLALIPWVAIPLVAGLDERFQWTPAPALEIHIGGLLFFFLGDAILSWSMAANKYFSTAVRIQTDRDHQVAAGGPYRYIRHPGYLGMIVSNIFTPFIFGSAWTLIPAFFYCMIFVIRIVFEDRMLQEELPGYKEYTENVCYRLIPGVW